MQFAQLRDFFDIPNTDGKSRFAFVDEFTQDKPFAKNI